MKVDFSQIFISFIILIFHTSLFADVSDKIINIEGQNFKLEKVYEGSDVVWGFDFYLLNGKQIEFDIIFSERSGFLKHLDLKTKKVQLISGSPRVFNVSQGGLLDVMVSKKKEVFLTYSEEVLYKGEKNATTSLFKGSLSRDFKNLVGQKIFEAHAYSKRGEHFGSRVIEDKEGLLFFSIGERNDREMAQKLSNHQGKILRIDQNGKAAKDNPFIHTAGALPEIFSYGHRNPQGLSLLNDGRLINAEFGPRGGDEINLIKKGANYGWPLVTYGREYFGPAIGVKEKSGFEQPLIYWVPSISPSGIVVLSQKNFPKLTGNLFLANLSGSHLRRVVFNDQLTVMKEEIFLADLEERFRQVKEAPNGILYFSTDSGKIYRLLPL